MQPVVTTFAHAFRTDKPPNHRIDAGFMLRHTNGGGGGADLWPEGRGRYTGRHGGIGDIGLAPCGVKAARRPPRQGHARGRRGQRS